MKLVKNYSLISITSLHMDFHKTDSKAKSNHVFRIMPIGLLLLSKYIILHNQGKIKFSFIWLPTPFPQY